MRALLALLVAGTVHAGTARAGDVALVNVAGKLTNPFAVAFGPAGEVYAVEMEKGERLVRLEADGRVTALAGTGTKGPSAADVPTATATFNGMHCLAAGPDGVLFLADTWNSCVRAYDPRTGKIVRVAGTGTKGFSGDGGPAKAAAFGNTYSVAFDPKLTRYVIADLDNRRVRSIDVATGVVTTVAGNGAKGVPADGAKATTAPLSDPRAAAVAADGTVYVLERGGHALRAVAPDGTIRTVAGTGKAGSTLGKTALTTAMNGPKHLAMDRDGGVLVVDTENHRLLKYAPAAGTLSLVAGTGKKGSAGVGGPPRTLEMNRPHGVAVHPTTGDIYLADSENGRVLKFAP